MTDEQVKQVYEALLAAQGILDALPSMFQGEAWADARSQVIQAVAMLYDAPQPGGSQEWLDAQHEPGHPMYGKSWAEVSNTESSPKEGT